jgi:predicted TIM-barrel fold metal-dependent hydrolase
VKLPEDAEVPIIDPFVGLSVAGALEAPVPRAALRDPESLAVWPSPDVTGYLFKKDTDLDRAERYETATDLDRWLAHLDRWSIARAGVAVTAASPNEVFDRLDDHKDRIFVTVIVDPHTAMDGVRRVNELAAKYRGVRALLLTPHFTYPFLTVGSREFFILFSKCVELNLTACTNVGVPGPRVPAHIQDPIHLDEVCWFFPELRVVMLHMGEPWVDTCVKMLLRWPNLYYATTGFAPKYYPPQIIALANTRASDKVIFSGYWPALSYDRVFREVSELALRDHVWPGFLGGNATTAFALAASTGWSAPSGS